jgi:hypothetical protein
MGQHLNYLFESITAYEFGFSKSLTGLLLLFGQITFGFEHEFY